MKRLITFLKRRFIRFKLKLRYKDFSGLGVDDNEKLCKSITIRMVNHPKSLFLIAPISMKRFIKNDELGIFIVMNNMRVKITNHQYHYDVLLGERDWDRLTLLFDNKTEKIREEFEEEMFNQINSSLHEILNKVKK